jgi:hypothetical protein
MYDFNTLESSILNGPVDENFEEISNPKIFRMFHLSKILVRGSWSHLGSVVRNFSSRTLPASQLYLAKSTCKAIGIVGAVIITKSFNCMLGMPNIGKSTLFNAITATQLAEAAVSHLRNIQ